MDTHNKKHPLRDYGFGDSTKMLTSTPIVVQEGPEGIPCPVCGCNKTYMLKVDVKNDLLVGGKGFGTYIGCPACPWASPMIMIGIGAGEEVIDPPSRDNPDHN